MELINKKASFKIGDMKIYFHRSSLSKLPRRRMPVYQGSYNENGFETTLVVFRNMQGSKYYWLLTFLGYSFVYWTDVFNSDYLSQFNMIACGLTSSYSYEVNKNPYLWNALTRKFSV